MVKTPKLMPKLQVKQYELILEDRTDNMYNVFRNSKQIGKIRVDFDCVTAFNGSEVSLIPYDVNIKIFGSSEILHIELLKKIILLTVIVS